MFPRIRPRQTRCGDIMAPRVGPRAKCCGCTGAFQALRAGSIPVARFARVDENNGEWRSLVAHPAGGRAAAGSNPVSPTNGKARKSGPFLSKATNGTRAVEYQMGTVCPEVPNLRVDGTRVRARDARGVESVGEAVRLARTRARVARPPPALPPPTPGATQRAASVSAQEHPLSAGLTRPSHPRKRERPAFCGPFRALRGGLESPRDRLPPGSQPELRDRRPIDS